MKGSAILSVSDIWCPRYSGFPIPVYPYIESPQYLDSQTDRLSNCLEAGRCWTVCLYFVSDRLKQILQQHNSRCFKLRFSRVAAAPSDCPLERTDARAGGRGPHFLMHLLVFRCCLIFVWGSAGLGLYPICSCVENHVECIQNHVWGSTGARDMTILVKHVFFAEVALGDNHNWKER